ncbi:hypothetical protein VMT65_14795 [Nocardia sp. CDC153]|uniref:hypothetical protein n=1 Tax=Nocardia sp. CDC153 TaxID=3112167 RepID=UPI002DB97DB8|nr:hypothetical protein [Nocardia sp. CDC153]MEC3954305.1 hypothetical protein [Nocardia sp. CDC153]
MADSEELFAAMDTIQAHLERLVKEGCPVDPDVLAKLHTVFDAMEERVREEVRRRGLRLPDSLDDAGQGDRPA